MYSFGRSGDSHAAKGIIQVKAQSDPIPQLDRGTRIMEGTDDIKKESNVSATAAIKPTFEPLMRKPKDKKPLRGLYHLYLMLVYDFAIGV